MIFNLRWLREIICLLEAGIACEMYLLKKEKTTFGFQEYLDERVEKKLHSLNLKI